MSTGCGRYGCVGLFAVALLSGCAHGYWSFPVCKAWGPTSEADGATPGAAPVTASSTPPSSMTKFATPVIIFDVVLLPFTAPVDLVFWITRGRALAVSGKLERSRELNLAGFPVHALGEILDALMMEPTDPEGRRLLEAHLQRAQDAAAAGAHAAMVAEALRHYDALVSDTSPPERRNSAFRERADVLLWVVRELAPSHPRLAELAGETPAR